MEDDKKVREFPNFDPTKDLSLAPQRRTKRGLGARPLLESEIKDIQKKARSAAEAARLLGVSYNTYKKYAREYKVFEDLKNPHGIGIRRGNSASGGFHPLDEVLNGKHPNYPIWKLKKRLLLNSYMEEKCNNCGFCERRVTDHRVPLVLDFLDGNRKNFLYDNLRMLCFNCSYLINGNLTGPKKEYEY
jgi:5-methylcytosine-specific restriction endonuclease McrA